MHPSTHLNSIIVKIRIFSKKGCSKLFSFIFLHFIFAVLLLLFFFSVFFFFFNTCYSVIKMITLQAQNQNHIFLLIKLSVTEDQWRHQCPDIEGDTKPA